VNVTEYESEQLFYSGYVSYGSVVWTSSLKVECNIFYLKIISRYKNVVAYVGKNTIDKLRTSFNYSLFFPSAQSACFKWIIHNLKYLSFIIVR